MKTKRSSASQLLFSPMQIVGFSNAAAQMHNIVCNLHTCDCLCNNACNHLDMSKKVLHVRWFLNLYNKLDT